jgi:DNA mismatch endonuclease (patch repair protein)
MTDTFSKEERSKIMRTVKSKGNKSTEIKLIQIFKERGIKGWRRNYKLFGKPDFAFPKSRIAVFVDGCFWHGHNCRNTKPSSNVEYWRKKIHRNIERDRAVTEYLNNKRWQVIRIWECELKKDELEKLKLLESRYN